jgi:hypothetical protein
VVLSHFPPSGEGDYPGMVKGMSREKAFAADFIGFFWM